MDSLLLLPAQVAPPPSDTWATMSPHWGWLIAVYFFLGGISGGAAFLAAMLHIFGRAEDRPMVRLGYLVSLVALIPSPLLLIVDLNRPERFWHMLWQSDTGGFLLKWWSPISLGVWILTFFGGVLVLALLGTWAGRFGLPGGLSVLADGVIGKVIAAVTGLLGLSLAGYTGSLLTATNRPLWADTPLLGLLFLLSGISAAAAAMLLFGRRTHPASRSWLGRMDSYAMLLELVVLVVMVVTLGAVATAVLGNGWGVALLVGTVLLGILVPLLAHVRPRLLGAATVPVAALLVLAGSFVLRSAIVLASEAI